jgi:3-keto-disaccharide hydrolase
VNSRRLAKRDGHPPRRRLVNKKRIAAVLLCVLLVAGVATYFLYGGSRPVPFGTPTQAPSGEGWVNLLDAAHAPDWKNTTDDKEIFEITEDMIHIFGRSLHPLRYVGYAAEEFGDFDLHLEFKVTKGANSGVFIRSQPNDPVYRGFEIQVLDDYGDPPNKNGSGAIYDVATPMFNMALPVGEWNSYDVTIHGQEVQIFMNGWMVIHTDLAKMTMHIGKYKAPFAELPLQGSLLLQDHGGEVWYKNIRLRKH